jgi:anaerobic selenocysteine-containing dehydrogenase
MRRREFIILTGAGAASTTLLSACAHPEEKLIPALIPDDQYVPGIDKWKASTCRMCDANCGILVRTRDHKANKIEGNPLHPVNQGALCARGQAALEALYNPDRITGPRIREGERGAGNWREITWDEAIKRLADELKTASEKAGADSVVFLTREPAGVNGAMAAEFKRLNGFPAIVETRRSPTPDPVFDIANATYLLSFGARFLETWLSPVMYSRAYGEFRRSTGKVRGRFVHIEPRMSQTAANADEWLPAAPATEHLVALGIAQVLIREKLTRQPLLPDLEGRLSEYSPENTASFTTIAPERLTRIARDLAASERPLVIGSETKRGSASQASLINVVNILLGNLNQKGGFFPPSDPATPLFSLPQKQSDDARQPDSRKSSAPPLEARAILIDDSNIAYLDPSQRERILKAPFIASFSSMMDETTELADLILPNHTFLESWDLVTATPMNRARIASLVAPVVAPELNTRQTCDVWIALSEQLGNPLPFKSAEEAVEAAALRLQPAAPSSASKDDDPFWQRLVEQGVWIGEPATAVNTTEAIRKMQDDALQTLSEMRLMQHSVPQNDADALSLIAYEHSVNGYGEYSNLPSLQELPDPMTSAMWGSWIEVHPKTAERLSIKDGDLVRVELRGQDRERVNVESGVIKAGERALVLPALLHPAIRPDVVAIPYGQGHSSSGRYARRAGGNAAALIPLNAWDHSNGELDGLRRFLEIPSSRRIEVTLTRVSGEGSLVRFGAAPFEEREHGR